jgi:hypothetical protein
MGAGVRSSSPISLLARGSLAEPVCKDEGEIGIQKRTYRQIFSRYGPNSERYKIVYKVGIEADGRSRNWARCEATDDMLRHRN